MVLGLPRSATSWLSVLLTTDKSLCIHEPFAGGPPETWPRDDRRFGISCTGAYLFPAWLRAHKCPTALIVRDPEAVDESLAAMGFGSTEGELQEAFAAADGRRFQFDDIWIEDEARALWEFLLPRVPFDALRYRQLVGLQIQPHMDKYRFDPDVFTEMRRREAGGGLCHGVLQ